MDQQGTQLMIASSRVLVLLLVAAAIAAAVVASVQVGAETIAPVALASGWSALTVESLATLLAFVLLAMAALAGLRAAHRPVSAGERPALGFGAGLAAGIGGLASALVLSALAGGSGPGVGGGADVMLLAAGGALTLVQTGAEELYFRGWLQPGLQSGWGHVAGLAVAAAAFALLHLVGGAVAWLGLLNLFLAGLWFGLLADRAGGLALPLGAHFGWNWAEELLFGVTPNPGRGGFGSLFDLELTGAPAWGGSAEGLNASLSATFVLLALVVLTSGPLTRRPLRG